LYRVALEMDKEEIKKLRGGSRSFPGHLDFPTAGLEGQLELPHGSFSFCPMA
jgi:hypothetical protein